MNYFEVIVNHGSIWIEPVKRLNTIHFHATVDGEAYYYFVRKKEHAQLHRGWFERGANAAFYHCRNAGTHVIEHPVKKYKRKKKISDKQLSLFD